MDYTAAPLEKLIEEFGKFQGVGRKGATRMAYQVLSMSDKDAAALADAIRALETAAPARQAARTILSFQYRSG